jgi:hypothetical protein
MNQRSIQTQNTEIPEQRGVGGETTTTGTRHIQEGEEEEEDKK